MSRHHQDRTPGLWPIAAALWLTAAGSALAAPAPAVISDIPLSKPFGAPADWRFTATQGPPVQDPTWGDGSGEPGAISLCLRPGPAAPCDAALRNIAPGAKPSDPFADFHYLADARIVRPRGDKGAPLLLVQTRSVHSGDGGQAITTQVLAYRRPERRFVRVYARATGSNNNEETRFIASGPLRGDIVSVEPTQNAPYGYWVSVSALTPRGAYRQALRYRSATHYQDGNGLAVIDSEMVDIERRLGLWKAGDPLPAPAGKCPRPHLIRMELWCGAKPTA